VAAREFLKSIRGKGPAQCFAADHARQALEGILAGDRKEAFKVTPILLAKRLKNLHKQAAALGWQLVAA